MTASDKAFTGSIAQIYDRLLVPMIFEPYARDLAQRIKGHNPGDLLETAAGTGAVTGALASLLPDTRIVATDLNEPMLAQAKARLADHPQIMWQQTDALALPFDDGRFDVVACQFGVMFFPDRVKGYSEARRVLKPGGHFIFNVWDKITDNEFADVVTEALSDVFPRDPPRFLARTPHGYCDADQVRDDLARSGLHRYRDRTGGAHEPCTVAARACGRLLPGHAVARRDRGARRTGPGSCDASGSRGACAPLR